MQLYEAKAIKDRTDGSNREFTCQVTGRDRDHALLELGQIYNGNSQDDYTLRLVSFTLVKEWK